jgi:hypothetical protein
MQQHFFLKTLLVFFIFPFLANAQSDIPLLVQGHYFSTGFGIPFTALRDLGHSPLRYVGSGIQNRTCYEHVQGNHIWKIESVTDNITLKPHTTPKPKHSYSAAQHQHIQINVGYFQKVKNNSEGTLNTYIGGSWSLGVLVNQFKLPSNNLVGFEMNMSLSPVFHARYGWDTNKKLSYTASMPLVSVGLRPNYLGAAPMEWLIADSPAKPILKSLKVYSLNKYFRFTHQVEFDKHLGNKHIQRLFYNFDYHCNDVSPKPLRYSSNAFGGQYMFNY